MHVKLRYAEFATLVATQIHLDTYAYPDTPSSADLLVYFFLTNVPLRQTRTVWAECISIFFFWIYMYPVKHMLKYAQKYVYVTLCMVSEILYMCLKY
jgi:hypothetical protein